MEYREKFIADISYRTLFWSLLAYLLCVISETMVNIAGDFLISTSKTKPSADWPNLLGMLGLNLVPAVMVLKEAKFWLEQRDIRSTLIGESHYWLSKTSADLMLIYYGAMSFVLGWGVYLFSNYEASLGDYVKIGFLTPLFFFLMSFTAVFSSFIKIDTDHVWFNRWRNLIRGRYRFISYGVFQIVFVILLITEN